MKRRDFVKATTLAGFTFTVPNLLRGMELVPRGYLKVLANEGNTGIRFFSIDSLGKNKLERNIALDQSTAGTSKWKLSTTPASFKLMSDYSTDDTLPFIFNINQHENHATLLGIIKDQGKVMLPAVMHFPDMGTLRITCNVPGSYLVYDSKRFIEYPYVKVSFPAATKDIPHISYLLEVVTICPVIKGIEKNPLYDGFRRNFISIFQLNPFLKILSNNSSSDACAFTLFKYSEIALHTPPLAEELTAMHLIRMTLDRYLAGQKGYGMLGYDYDNEWDIPESPTRCHSLDSFPSLLIAASNYVLGKKDKKWFTDNEKGLLSWTDKMLSSETDNNGLLKFCLSGNSGSWKGDKSMRPANWWDTIGFGHEDAYSNALAYRALVLLERMYRRYGSAERASWLMARAEKLKAAYTKTFYNPSTGVLAGWKSADGQLHDYYFTFVNGMAITYNLVEDGLANKIMDKILNKMKTAGFTNFELGMPGNLIPVKRADYTDLVLEAGGGKREDNLDGFQIYENGGATACFTYFTIRALQKLGRRKEADVILHSLLKSLSEGNFQGRCANGRSKDWKTWTGECWGYEGFLVDNYLFLLAALQSFPGK